MNNELKTLLDAYEEKFSQSQDPASLAVVVLVKALRAQDKVLLNAFWELSECFEEGKPPPPLEVALRSVDLLRGRSKVLKILKE